MKVLEYIIRAKDATGAVLSKALGGVTHFVGGVFRNLMNIQAGFQMIETGARRMASVFRAVWGTVLEAFKIETMTTQFAILMGGMDAAKKRMAELRAFAEKTPFQLEEIVTASRQLHVFSGGAMGGTASLTLLGDAAAAAGQKIDEVAFWVGRAYAMIKGGQPFGEAAMRLQEMGLMTPAVRQRMEELQASGAKASDVFGVLRDSLGKFGGGMDTLSKTGDGLISTLKDNWIAALAEFGGVFAKLAKVELQYLITKLSELKEDGSIERWANRAKKVLEPVSDLLMGLFDGKTRSVSIELAWEQLKSVFEYGRDVIVEAGEILAGKIEDAFRSAVGLGPRAPKVDPFVAEYRKQFPDTLAGVTNPWGANPDQERTAGQKFADRQADLDRRRSQMNADRRNQDGGATSDAVRSTFAPLRSFVDRIAGVAEDAVQRQREIADLDAGEQQKRFDKMSADAGAAAEKMDEQTRKDTEEASGIVEQRRQARRSAAQGVLDQSLTMATLPAYKAEAEAADARRIAESKFNRYVERERAKAMSGRHISAKGMDAIALNDRRAAAQSEMEATKVRTDQAFRNIQRIADVLEKNLQVGGAPAA